MNKKLIVTLLSSVLLITTGCSNLDKAAHKPNELTGNIERNSMSEGLAVGATVGLSVATAFSTSGASLVYSALVGTGVFGFVGMHNDSNEEEVRQYLDEHGITVEDKFDKVVISFSEDVTFDLQKTKLKEEYKPILNGVAMVLNKLDGKAKFEVVGHADYTGPDTLNQFLSNERATVVTEYLLSQGVKPENFTDFYGVSSSQPKNYCLDLSCLRRVELVIYKNSLLTEIN